MVEKNISSEQVIGLINNTMRLAKNEFPLKDGLEIIRHAYYGTVYVTGSFVIRPALKILYGTSLPDITDVDILLKDPINYALINTPIGWKRLQTSHGGLRFIINNTQFDIWSIHAMPRFVKRKMEYTLENYLATVPLTSHSIAYNPDTEQVFGEKGVSSIKTRVVSVNDIEEARWYAENKRKSLSDIVDEKAKSLGFTSTF